MKRVYIVTKEEIADAIVSHIGTFMEGRGFFPYRISNSSPDLKIPDEVSITLELIPRGAKVGDFKHAI